MAEAYLKSRELENLEVASSGTVASAHHDINVSVFARVAEILDKQGLAAYRKSDFGDQLSSDSFSSEDINICMSDEVVAEAKQLVDFAQPPIIWHIKDVDVGEQRIEHTETQLDTFLGEVYGDIKEHVDMLVQQLGLLV